MTIFLKLLFACLFVPTIGSGQNNIEPKSIVLSGKILNYNDFRSQETISLIYQNTHILNSTTLVSNIDDEGQFRFTFSRYSPEDVLLIFGSAFKVFVCPGDSMYTEFEASNNPVRIYESIKFYGDGVSNNNAIASFNKFYFSNRPSFDLVAQKQKHLSPADYTSFIDSVRNSFKQYYEVMNPDICLSDTAKAWINASIEMYFLNKLLEYPDSHLKYNNLKKGEWFVEDDYFNPVINCDISGLMLLNSEVTGVFVNRYHHKCVSYLNQKHLFQNGKGEYRKDGKADVFTSTSITISLTGYENAVKDINPILKFTNDNVIRQLVIREYYSQQIDSKGLSEFFDENKRKVFDKYITDTLIRKQFFDYYRATGVRSNQDLVNAEIQENVILDEIFKAHKNKVIYVKVWGTWCAPCLHEIPYSNLLIDKFNPEEIAFVFICIDSPEDQWNAMVDRLKINGEHYWFDKDKSNQLRADYSIIGIPFYFLVDKNGEIYKKGNTLKPSQFETKEQIERLIKD